LCCPLAIGAAAVRACHDRSGGALLALATLFAAEVTYGALAGGKGIFVTAVLAIAIPFTTARRQVPKGLLAGSAVVFLGVVIPFSHAYRDIVHTPGNSLTPGQAASAAPGIFHQAVILSPSVIPSSLDYLALRVQEIDGPAIIVQRTPSQIPYSSPAQLVAAPLVDLIPRALWPGKPVLDAGNEFSQQYYGLGPGTYSSITPVGDLYRHGGWTPVVVGMLLLGCGIRGLDEVLDARNPHAAFLVLLIFPVLAEPERDWITMLAVMPSLILTWLLVVTFAFSRRGDKGIC
jgi:hypothetical protein